MCKKSGINLTITIAMVTKLATKNPENMKVAILEHIWERKWNIGKGIRKLSGHTAYKQDLGLTKLQIWSKLTMTLC